MTSLAHQLKRLALPQNDPSLLSRREAASLLFDPKEAANIDRETFFALGCTGLEELMGIDSSFEAFQETLFSLTSKSMERSVQTKAVNQQLDESISLFLTHLSPYFMLKPAQKCLEWLIHRFHIHLYNQDSLIGCVLPYHETRVFVRVIQLLKISNPTHKWNWLHPIQKPGVPLARGTLITHCYKNLDFLEFVCKMVTKSVKVFSEHPGSAAQLRVLLSFYVSSIVAALDAVEKISDTLVAKLLPYVQKGLKSPLVDYKAATYMIICQLAVKTVMAPTLVKALVSQISKTLLKTPSLVKEGLGCLIILLQNQQHKDLGRNAFIHLCKVPDLVTILQGIASVYDISPLLTYLLPNLIQTIIRFPTGESSEETNYDICKSNLEAILCNIPLEKDLDKGLACTFLKEYLSYGEQQHAEPHIMSELGKSLLPLIRLLENKYPEALDLVLEEHLKNDADEKRQELFHQFISLSTSGGKYELLADCDTSLLLSLNHPQPAVRHLALQHLKDIIETSKAGFDETFIKEAILGRLVDDNLEVVMSALRAFKIYSTHFSTEVTVSNLLALFDRVDLYLGGQWYKALEEATNLLIQEASIKDHPDLCNRVIMTLIPYMVFTSNNPDSAELKMALHLAKCGVCDLHPLTKGWPEALEEIVQKAGTAELLGPANSRMAQLLSTNLASAESSSALRMVEHLVQVADIETGNLRQKVACHVLSNALVQGCSPSRDPKLQGAIRVFQLLEKRLRRMETSEQEVPKKWHLDAESGDKLQVELISVYIEKLNAGQAADMEDAVLTMLLLRNFMSILTAPETFPRGDTWWNPETMDRVSQNYLRLLIGLFDVIASYIRKGVYADNFQALIGFLFKEHLKGNLDLFCFLSVLWTYNCNLSNPLGCTVNRVLQTRALYIGQALIASQTAQKKQRASPSSPVVVSLMINLLSPIREVRRAAIFCLQELSSVKDSPYYIVIQSLVQKTEEIVADSTYVVQALGVMFEELQTPGTHKIAQKLSSALDLLLAVLQAPSCPSYVNKVLLRALRDVNGETVLSQLLPILERLLEKVTSSASPVLKDEAHLLHLLLCKFNEHSATLLAKNPQSLEIFVRALTTTQSSYPGMPSYQITALGQITKSFYTAVDDGNVQQKLLGVLFDLLLNCKNPVCAQAVNTVFKAISINAEHISAELEPPGRDKGVSTVRQTRRQKMQKLQRKSPALDSTQDEGSVNWSRTTLILELLQHKKKLKDPQLLVPSLFYLLSRCLEPSTTEQGTMEYTKQLILSCLLNICQKISSEEDKKDVLDEEKFNVELIVQCVRTSEMPQTHHHALLLLGAAAGIFPDKVLHNIMPIFTFMGANVMRLDDNYSFQVISKTVQTVIPALIQAGDGASEAAKDDMEQVVGNIIHVFVDALPHVPEHRSLPILSQLIDTVGAQRFLWVLLVLLFQQHVTKTVTVAANGEKDAVLERDTEFWISVCCEFSVYDQLHSLVKVLQFLTKLPENKDEDDQEQRKSKPLKQKSQQAEVQFFNVETHSAKQLRHFKFLSVSFMAQLLASLSFVGKVVECEAADELKEFEQRLLEQVLCYIHLVAGSVEGHADKPTVKFWRALLNKSYELLDKVNALLPTETFIPVIRGLMSNQLPSVRRKAMDLLNNKLQQRTKWDRKQVELLLGLINDLLSIVHRKPNAEEEEQAINRQTALYSLKLLCKCFGPQRQQVFVPVLSAAVDLISAEEPEDKNVMGSALLCVAEVTSIIKALAIPQLPRLMPSLLTTLKHKKELLTSEIHLLSTVTALQKVVETLPHFLSPYLQDTLLQVVRLDKIAAKVGPTSQLCIRVKVLKETLATNLASRVLLPAITKCYCHLVDTLQSCLGSLMDILKEHIAVMDKQQLSSHQTELTTFFLKALDYRAEHSESELEKVGSTEGHIINGLLIMVMKLSEVTFRPLFFKLFDWSSTDVESKERLLTFCRLADCIADKLKGLFTLFAGHLVKPFAELLNQTNIVKTDEAFFDSENHVEKSCLLLEFVLNCLHKIFLYDTQHFVSKERAEALMMPLVDQLENMLGGDDTFQARVSRSLVPCIAQFSVAMADDSLWKPLNYQILLKMRHSSPKVRFAALLVLVELVEKLRENYMILLPESIPFLAELMEDECEEVEQQCQKTIKQLEIILGEPLQSYF